ncbi:hypothetical protein HA402_000365 [Bradysia odoriphaga]|nr:hypothetical protein HA402_000365 [Bradysia odoriphaga]
MIQIAQSRVVNGDATTIDHFPWIVSMQYYGAHRCGGSIITTNRILTAAHCTINITANLLSIRAGSTDSQVGGELVAVTDFTNHHLYNPTTLENDISVMVIASRLTTGSTVAVIPLPMHGAPVTDGIVANVAGWGALCEKCPGITTLQYVGLPVLSNANCNSMYGESVTPSMLCAGFAEGGRDACQGDSGGPLNIGNLLIGVVSWGDGCARPNSPGVFTRVAYFRNWINGLL